MPKQKNEESIDILTVDKGQIQFCILGTTPLILNRMSEKAMRELLAPKGKKTAADKAANLKHIPLEEFRSSPYIDRNPNGPTLLQHLASAFKGSLKGAAVDLPGAKKAQIGRLTWVEGERIAIYGVPQMIMSVVRSADMNRTPDVRTRAIVPQWACVVTVSYVQPLLRQQSVANLMASAGIMQGIGDWRTEKGAGNYGSFELVEQDDPRFLAIRQNGGRAAQIAAMENPEPYDEETAELYQWFLGEASRRGFKDVGKSNGSFPTDSRAMPSAS